MIRNATVAALATAAFLLFIWAMAPNRAVAAECEGRIVVASWYGTESGSRTADGSFFDGSSLTAAMPSRKHLGERYRVTYRGKSVNVTINDVGPAKWTKRGLDLSEAAASKIELIPAGVGKVCIERL